MMMKLSVMVLGLSVFSQAQAFPCFITMIKDNCWTGYNLSVDVMDVKHSQKVVTIVVPKGKSWTRVPFECSASEELGFNAKFTPVIWEHQADKTYPGSHDWFLPDEIKPGSTAWNINVCYSSDFESVPMPPTATNHCVCDTASIPAIPPQ